MRVLQVCNKPPYPPVDGGCIAMNNTTNGLLQEGHQVKVLAMNTPKHFVDPTGLPKEYSEAVNPELVSVDTSVRLIPAFLDLFSSSSYNVSRFYDKQFAGRLIAILKKESFDIIQLESLFVTPYIETIRQHSSAKLVLRTHNVEHEIWERLAHSENKALKKIYLAYLARKLKRFELSVINQVDGIAAISGRDKQLFLNNACKKPIEEITFGVSIHKDTTLVPATKPNTLFHLGSMDWQPNLQGIDWFVHSVWPAVHSSHPQLELHLAGRNMPFYLKHLNSNNIVIDGEVPDAMGYMKEFGVLVVPLFSGSGIRVKIIEALALGKLVIATPVALEGIAAEHKKNVLIASDETGFKACIDFCFNEPEKAEEIRKQALLLASSKYNNKTITLKLIQFYQSLL